MIYKYYSINQNTLSCLINNQMWLSHPSVFNDPFDCRYEYEHLTEEEFIKFIPREKAETQESIKELGMDTINKKMQERWSYADKNTFIACFSEYIDEILMWSHYANKHHGLCIAYEQIKPTLANDKNMLFLSEANYSDEPPKLNFLNFSDKIAIYFKKHPAWRYEKEVRLVSFPTIAAIETLKDTPAKKGILIDFPHELLEMKSVYFGLRCSMENKRTIKNILKDSVSYYKMLEKEIYNLTPEKETFDL